MIISASRRTDIPAFFSEWFFNRIKEGFVYVQNPLYQDQIRNISLSPEILDCIVFWTKNPAPMMKRLPELDPEKYPYYFQFTLTGYGKDIERHLPDKEGKLIPIFQKLARMIGKEKVIWRYDPIMFVGEYTPEAHLRIFERFAYMLQDSTEKCVISFVDVYKRNQKRIESIGYKNEPEERELRIFSKKLVSIARKCKLTVATCAENIELSDIGVEHNNCIDKKLIERIIGCEIKVGKDKSQRQECGCVESIDIGAYNTCKNGCIYCYANYSNMILENNWINYKIDSPLLCKAIPEGLKLSTPKLYSLKIKPHVKYDELPLFNYMENK